MTCSLLLYSRSVPSVYGWTRAIDKDYESFIKNALNRLPILSRLVLYTPCSGGGATCYRFTQQQNDLHP